MIRSSLSAQRTRGVLASISAGILGFPGSRAIWEPTMPALPALRSERCESRDWLLSSIYSVTSACSLPSPLLPSHRWFKIPRMPRELSALPCSPQLVAYPSNHKQSSASGRTGYTNSASHNTPRSHFILTRPERVKMFTTTRKSRLISGSNFTREA